MKSITKIILWLGLMIGAVMVAFGIWYMTPGHDTINGLKWMQALQNIAVFIVPAWLAIKIWGENPIVWLQLNKRISWKMVVGAILLMMVLTPGINLFSQLNQLIELPECLRGMEHWMQQKEEESAALIEQIMAVDSVWGLIVNLLVIAVLTGIGEEITFRGIVQGVISERTTKSQRTPHVAIWITAILFSAIHLQFYGFIPRMLIGALFGYMLSWTGSMWIPILMHTTNNAQSTLLYYLCHHHVLQENNVELFGYGDTLWVGIVSLIVGGIGIYIFLRSRTISKASSLTS